MYLSAYQTITAWCVSIYTLDSPPPGGVIVLPRSATHDNSTSVNTYCGWIVQEKYLRAAELSAKMRRRACVGLLMLGRHRRQRANII